MPPARNGVAGQKSIPLCNRMKGHVMFDNPQQLRLALIALGVIFCVVALAFFGVRAGASVPASAAFFLV